MDVVDALTESTLWTKAWWFVNSLSWFSSRYTSAEMNANAVNGVEADADAEADVRDAVAILALSQPGERRDTVGMFCFHTMRRRRLAGTGYIVEKKHTHCDEHTMRRRHSGDGGRAGYIGNTRGRLRMNVRNVIKQIVEFCKVLCLTIGFD